MERIVLVHGSVVGGRADVGGAAPARRALRARRRSNVRASRRTRPSTASTSSRTPRSSPDLLEPGDHLVGHSYGGVDLAARSGGAARALALADRDRAACHARRARRPGRRRLRRGGSELYASARDRRPGGVPSQLPRGRRLRVRPSLPAPAGARAGRASADGRARPVGGGDPARRARRGAVPEARRLRAPPPGVRRDLRRPRARAACRARRAPGLRPRGPAPPGLQRPARRLRRARASRSARRTFESRSRASSCSRSRRRTRGFASFTISSRYTT